jgi:hypothetical protein
MNDWSFNEKSLLATLLAVSFTAAFYFQEVQAMLATGNRDSGDIAVAAIVAVILLIAIEAVHHAIIAAKGGETESDDERDRAVRLRGAAAERRALEAGVVVVIGHIAVGSLLRPANVDLFLVGNLLVAVLVVAEVAGRGLELWLYRRGF